MTINGAHMDAWSVDMPWLLGRPGGWREIQVAIRLKVVAVKGVV